MVSTHSGVCAWHSSEYFIQCFLYLCKHSWRCVFEYVCDSSTAWFDENWEDHSSLPRSIFQSLFCLFPLCKHWQLTLFSNCKDVSIFYDPGAEPDNWKYEGNIKSNKFLFAERLDSNAEFMHTHTVPKTHIHKKPYNLGMWSIWQVSYILSI